MRGSIVALVTPYDLSGAVDEEALGRLVEWHIQEGTDAIVLCGTTGEAPVLSEEEHFKVIRRGVMAAAGRIPVIAGTGSYSTSKSICLTEKAKQAGAEACLVVFPYYNRPTAEGCYLHIEEIGKVGLPIIVYHHPGRTGVRLSAEAMEKIALLPSVMGIKDCSMDVAFFTELRQRIEKPLFTGDDVLALPCMAIGAEGIISVIANIIPKPWKQLTEHLLKKELGEAQSLFRRLYPLIHAIGLETNPQGIKYALSLIGRCNASMRLPLLEPCFENKAEIKRVIYAMGDLFDDLSASDGSHGHLPFERATR